MMGVQSVNDILPGRSGKAKSTFAQTPAFRNVCTDTTNVITYFRKQPSFGICMHADGVTDHPRRNLAPRLRVNAQKE